MTYCGAIGSVNVMSFMSTDLFDESQENPFLLTAARSEAGSPAKASASLSRASLTASTPASKAASAELPLDDAPATLPAFGLPPPLKTEAARDMEPTPASPLQYSPGRTVQFMSASPLRSILKRQSSYESAASTTASAADYHAAVYEQQQQQQLPYQYQHAAAPIEAAEEPFLPTGSELHKLLYSLTRFGLANDASAQAASSPAQPQFAPPPAPSAMMASPGKTRSVSFASNSTWQQQHQRQQSTDKKRRARSRRASSVKAGRDASDAAFAAAACSRGSVTYATVKNLLRGGRGGRGASPSRTAHRSIPDFRRKSTGTVSSRLKRRQKFARPTILTDAYHRVSDMKLGTKPMSTAIKHLAFPYMWGEAVEDQEEADPGMPSPRGQLRRQSFVSLETLDKIGTRAACPVHLLDEAAPDFSHVRARVDSYNHVRSPKRGLRRPSAWLPPSVVAADDDDQDQDAKEDEDGLEYGEQSGGFTFSGGLEQRDFGY